MNHPLQYIGEPEERIFNPTKLKIKLINGQTIVIDSGEGIELYYHEASHIVSYLEDKNIIIITDTNIIQHVRRIISGKIESDMINMQGDFKEIHDAINKLNKQPLMKIGRAFEKLIEKIKNIVICLLK